MRKLLGIIAVLCIAMTTPALAYNVDLKALSDEEILQLKEDVIAEIKERDLALSDVMHEGTYTIGEDIAAGSYMVVPADGERHASIAVCETAETYKDQIIYEQHYLSDGDSVVINLKDGNILMVKDNALFTVSEKSLLAP